MPSTYEPIATTTLGSAQTSYTFSSITGIYTDLILVCSVKGSGNEYIYLQFNGDTGTNYSFTLLGGNGVNAISARAATQSQIQQGYAYTDTSNFSYQGISHIMNYSNATTYKTVLTRADNGNNNSGASVGLWRNSNAITSIKVFPSGGTNMSIGTSLTLYGIKAA
jgi:hypothetical protein